ncbi:uncharacterized protein HMPREF1541_02843 [Cyphellophora europaea CBS 101466]|uniref:Uncharacterized protein n=1 Tax=Cyphellophora europaea (strain CBS 101466) TaxID=1220924 RepID=W2S6W4_CYPE1|nr:uncharacterized protein HMPREF1541_02843 [Cyphellophora europaea CBS 101466]ETN43684.1 hypothetical protein HMPREF1541_02843 [Cyphellophora europaea CBS 101466]
MRITLASVLTTLSLTLANTFQPTSECPLLGPSFSSDFDLTKTDAFSEAVAAFPEVIEALFETGSANASTSSFVIDVYSAVTNTSIYSYSHEATAPALNESFPSELNDETIFRIGSVSKLYTVYAILAHAGSLEVFNHPITQYLPELAGNAGKDPLNRIVWEDVTVGALASHQAGVGEFPLNYLGCFYTGEPCDTDKFLDWMRDRKRASQPISQSSLYADGGFGILGLALARMTNQTYNDALQTLLAAPLHLNHTGSLIPTDPDVNGIIIPNWETGASAWGHDNQVIAPSGGLYSNLADLRATGLSILHSHLLSPHDTRAWLKPHAHTASLTTSAGAPWEINRLTLPVSAANATNTTTRYRLSDLYTKAGGQPGYTAVFMLSPDHQLGLSVLVAGTSATTDRWTLRAAAAETFVTAAEHAAMENARSQFAGVFVDDEAHDGSNVTLTVEEGRPGLGIKSLYVDGVDSLANISSPYAPLPEGVGVVARLYPTGLEERLAEDGSVRAKYRAVAEVTPFPPEARARIEGGKGLFDDGCVSWLNTAFWETEDGQVLDEFVLQSDGKGRLVSVRSGSADGMMVRSG